MNKTNHLYGKTTGNNLAGLKILEEWSLTASLGQIKGVSQDDEDLDMIAAYVCLCSTKERWILQALLLKESFHSSSCPETNQLTSTLFGSGNFCTTAAELKLRGSEFVSD